MLELKLIRTLKTHEYTEGTLINIDTNEELCDTLEDVVRDINMDGDLDDEGEGKVYGETAIPFGTYKIEVTYSPKFERMMVLIRDVPHFTGIRIHWGRTAKQSAGCLLVGKKYDDGKLNNSGMTSKLVDLLLENDNVGSLEII